MWRLHWNAHNSGENGIHNTYWTISTHVGSTRHNSDSCQNEISALTSRVNGVYLAMGQARANHHPDTVQNRAH